MTSQGPRPDEVLAQLAAIRFDEHNLDAVLLRVSELAVQAVPGADEVSVTLVRNQKAFTAAHSGSRAVRLDEEQYAAGYGPCLDVAQATGHVLVQDMAAETRWPSFTAVAVGLGIGSSLSLALPVQNDLVGALNLYGENTSAFDDDAVELATSFASYAAVAVANAHLYDTTVSLAENMRLAMESRAAIEQAKGILMNRQGINEDAAFALLSAASQNTNRKLRDVALELIAGVVLPDQRKR